MNIQFTDRYGGNPPAWFTACHACEAMGFSPEPCDAYEPPQDSIRVAACSPCPRPDEHAQADFDGWHFLRCTSCLGTAKVSWLVAVSRIPRWLVKGARFFWQMSSRQYKPPTWTYRQHIWLVFKCAFVYDVLRLVR